jgi:hypothetical protein
VDENNRISGTRARGAGQKRLGNGDGRERKHASNSPGGDRVGAHEKDDEAKETAVSW